MAPDHERRHYGVYRAIVMNISDPNGKGRLKVKIPALFGSAVTDWIWGSHSRDTDSPPDGDTHLPAIGDVVWVAFEAGDPDFPVWLGTLLP